MAKTLQQILGAPNLIGVIQKTKTGIPDGLLPPGMLTVTRSIEGNTGSYTKVTGTRNTARQAVYGSPSRRRELKGVLDQPVKLIHTNEHIFHQPSTLMNLLSPEGARQVLGRDEIARQTADFRQRFDNLRLACVHSALALGAIYFDGGGNLLPTSSGAVISIDFGVPAGNKDQLNALGGGNIISASWATDGTNIVGQLQNLRTAAQQLTGYTLRNAFYGDNVLEHLLSNTAIASLISGSAGMSEQAAAGDVPRGLLGFQWFPLGEAMYEDNDGTMQTWWDGDAVVFTPAVENTWWGFLQGSIPVPTDIGNVSADGSAAISDLMIAQGMFSYAHVMPDPATIKHIAGDTFLPVLKVPNAIFLADTVF